MPIQFILIFIVFLAFILFIIFTKKGRLLSTKIFFWGGEVVKDYGWLDEAGNINSLVKQRVQVIKYKKDAEVFHVLMVNTTAIGSVKMIPIKLSEQQAQKLVDILSGKVN